MRILVLGGTVFLSSAVAELAVGAGHEVVCAARGTSGGVPSGAELVIWDRVGPPPDELGVRPFDAVVDVASNPSWVRRAVASFADAHWVFVSTINVYADDATPGGTPATAALRRPRHDDVDLRDDPEAYGGMKVACEQAVEAGASSWTVVRPGLIIGPGDPSGRFAYWPRRLATGGQVLAPGDPGDVVQVIDVRDLAAWLVLACENHLAGTYDGTGPAQPLADLLTAAAAGVSQGSGRGVSLTWVGQDVLEAQGVQPWSGPESIPLWLPRPAYDGMLARDVTPSLRAGLVLRPIAETTRDTLAWLEATHDAVVTGIDVDRERDLLAARPLGAG